MSFVLDVLAWLLFGVRRTVPCESSGLTAGRGDTPGSAHEGCGGQDQPIPERAGHTAKYLVSPQPAQPAVDRPRCVCTHPPAEHDNETGWCRYGDCSIYEPIDDHWVNYRPEPKPETEAA